MCISQSVARRSVSRSRVFALPNYVPVLAGLAFLLLKLTRMGGRRTATEKSVSREDSFFYCGIGG